MANVTIEKTTYKVDKLCQWDKNQELIIYGLSLAKTPEIHFTNDAMENAIVRQASMDQQGVISVEIPNSLLQKPYRIHAYVCAYENDSFKSLYLISIPMIARKKPLDYTIESTDGEIYSFNALENRVTEALTEIENLAQEYASEFKPGDTYEIGDPTVLGVGLSQDNCTGDIVLPKNIGSTVTAIVLTYEYEQVLGENKVITGTRRYTLSKSNTMMITNRVSVYVTGTGQFKEGCIYALRFDTARLEFY